MVTPKDLDLCIHCQHIGDLSFCITQIKQRILMGQVEIVQDCDGYCSRQSAVPSENIIL